MKHLSIIALCIAALMITACGDEDPSLPSASTACQNYVDRCSDDASLDLNMCTLMYNGLDDCTKLCLAHGTTCENIRMCMNDQSGPLYEEQCKSDSNDNTHQGLFANDCVNSNCSYEVSSCEANVNCVSIVGCYAACAICADCDEGDCQDSCNNEYRTGTTQFGDVMICAGENGCDIGF